MRNPLHANVLKLGALFCLALGLSETSAMASTTVRVLILENQPRVRLTVKGAYLLRALPSGAPIQQGKNLSAVEVSASPVGFKVGGQLIQGRGFRVEPERARDLFVNQSRFRGTLDLWKDGSGNLYGINELDLEQYLYGVMHHEVAPWWPMEALKAQAIAARTYALYQRQAAEGREYHLKSSNFSQVYGGSTREPFRTCRAVDQTTGKVLTFEGKIFPTYFHATCAGVTAASGELWNLNLKPLGGGVKCNFCRISPHTHWSADVPLSDIEEKLNKNGRSVGQVLNIESVTQTPSGRTGSLRITGTTGEAVLAAKDFRIWIGGDRMRSTNFKVTVKDDTAEFHGKGWGHGVGLCQWGALGQSLLGHSHQKILQFYYPGSKIGSHGAELK